MDRESPELIEKDMHETRQALTDKVAALEQQVVGTFQGATSAVQETVETVKSAVKESVATVHESVATASANVKATLDVPEHVRQHPWAAVTGATVVGVIAGFALSNTGTQAKKHSAQRTFGTGNGAPSRPPVFAAPAQPGPTKPGIFDELLDRVSQEIKQLSETAITALGRSLRQNLDGGIQQIVQNIASFGMGYVQSHEDRPGTTERREARNDRVSSSARS